MRRILLNRARDKKRHKRGGARTQLDLERIEIALETPEEDLIAVDEAIEQLARWISRVRTSSSCVSLQD